MNFTADTPTTTMTIYGLTFSIPQPFKEGDPLKANEAEAMNQLLIENCRNNFNSTIVDLVKERGLQVNNSPEDAANLDEEDKQKLQADFTQYVGLYEFGVRKGGQRFADPVVREAREIGKSKIRPALLKAGVKAGDIDTNVMNTHLDKYWPVHGEKWMAQARQIIALREAAAAESLEISPDEVAA